MNEFNELFIPATALSNDFDYIALGHFHKYSKLSKNAFYSGSTDNLTFTDAGDKKGFIEIELIDKKLKTKFVPLKNRPMISNPPIKCKNLRLEQVMEKIKQTMQEIKPKEKTFRIVLEDISPEIYRGLDFGEIRKLSNDATHYEIKANISKDKNVKTGGGSKIDALAREFKIFLDDQDIKEKETLLQLALGYIEKIESQEEGK